MNCKRIVSLVTLWGFALVIMAGCAIPLPIPTGGFLQTGTDESIPTPEPTPDPLTIVEEGGVMATIATRSLRVRSEPNDNSEVVAGVAVGESYRVLALSEDGLWVQLALDNAEAAVGWVSTNFVTVEGEITNLTGVVDAEPGSAAINSAGLTLVPTPEAGFAQVNTDGVRLRVRGGPSTENAIVGYIYDGESYAVLERSADGLWVRIPASTGNNTDNSSGGWVAAEFLRFGQ